VCMNVTIDDDKTQAHVYVRTHDYMYSQQSNTLFSNNFVQFTIIHILYIHKYIYTYIHVIVVTQAQVLNLPDIYAQARGHAAPKGQCGCIRQSTSACATINMLHFR